MPYSGPQDKKLPSNVKKMPAKKRRRWVAIFNSTFKNCRSQAQGGGKGSPKRCETMAFRFANGAVKELNMKDTLLVLEKMRESYGDGEDNAEKVGVVEAVLADLRQQEGAECDCEVKEGEKCPHDMIELAPKPFGGSTSFSDHDEYQDAIDTEMHVKELGYVFRMLVDNIFEDEEMSLPQKADAVVAAATELSARVKAPPEGRRSILDKMKAMVKGVLSGGDSKSLEESVFVSYKDADGQWRWMIINTNKYEDREGEIFSEKSHKEYIHFVEKTGQWPELWLWHTPGTRIGVASLVDYVDGFVVHSGTFDEGMADVAERLHKMQKKLGVSHGYEYLLGDEEDKVYDHYRTFELTICPAHRAANIWGTEFETFTKEVTMGFTAEKREFFVDILGEERVSNLETALPALGKELEKRGVNFKDLVEALMPDAESEGDPPKAEGGGDPPKAESEGDPPKAEGEESEPKSEVKTTVEDRMSTIENLVVKIGAAVDQLATDQKDLVEGIGDRIASGLDEALTGQKRPPNGDKRPSQAKETEITEEEAEEAAKVKGPGDGAHPQARALVNDLMNRGNVPQG